LRITPSLYNSYFYYSKALSNHGLHERALTKAQIAVKNSNNNTIAMLYLGEMLVNCGRKDEALEILLKLAENNPKIKVAAESLLKSDG
jgi:tetratricopeptide (TPR) repeat protein